MTDAGKAGHWATQSLVTDPGKAAAAIDELPAELGALRKSSVQLVFHYRGGGDFVQNGVPAERVAEIHTRYADDMLALVLDRGKPDLARRRRPADRVVGCCRDSTVLFLALARRKGIPARARVGFASYFYPGWMIDHEVAEVWDEAAGRWRLVEPQQVPPDLGHGIDWLDLAGDQFMTGPRAWLAARAGTADPGRFAVWPDLDVPVLRGWPYLAHNLVHDLAALSKAEMLLWDGWGMQKRLAPGPVPEQDAAALDEVAAATADPGITPEEVAALAGRDGLRVPATVTRYDPFGGPPTEVTLRGEVTARGEA